MERRAFLVSLLPLAACACADDFDCGSEPDSAEDRKKQLLECEAPPAAPSPVPPPQVANNIEFRVLGDVLFDPGTNGADIQFGTTQEGTARVLSTLPWFSSTKTFRDSLFIILNVSATGFGLVQAQIIVNGELFREATATGFNPKVALSGLFVK